MLPPNPSTLVGIHQTAKYLLAHLSLYSEETAVHSKRITSLAVRLARTIGLNGDGIIAIRYGTLLHDIGKMEVPLEILHKPSALKALETEIINLHPEHGSQIARLRKMPAPVCDVILYHHERYDGRGYPDGLRGDDIPLAARIVAVVDTFDTIVNKRCYREAQAVAIAREEIKRCSGTQFDPNVAAKFLKMLDEIELRRTMRPVAA